MWVHPDFQRRGIATRLLESARMRAHWPARVANKTEMALSHTTEAGAALATAYFGSQKFLVYRPQ